MRPTELPWNFLGRRVRPIDLSILIAYAAVGYRSFFIGGPLLVSFAFSVVAATLLMLGWLCVSDRCAHWGLLLASGVFASHIALVVMTGTPDGESLWLGVAFFICSAGTWLLERVGRVGRPRTSDGEASFICSTSGRAAKP